MISSRPSGTTFHEGDEIVLAQGTYQGTLGIFVRLRNDRNWADITERNGTIRSHPVAWLAHSAALTSFATDAFVSFCSNNQIQVRLGTPSQADRSATRQLAVNHTPLPLSQV